ncbi:CRISPR-associated ring nuclease Csm6 [Acinetobacter johnsonii]|jgi:CRISPR-associated protein (TIGR02584 family)|uniref:CRISPR-associated ring nuclease Csm6 n=1 Tax=Acinetobacter johnsonii TaxID=40214 RepID=UPI0024485EA3|nr:CRISPR-associated ring nuclease Csm6 [Acinetobacter johnsonii]MDH1712730.1 CRISPR-associated ring nuclease Csm6 [Acinetobacter johnsonii]
MSKNILLLVTGMTPQIITETVWALACDPNNQNPWVPDEIKVVTTLDGIKEIEKTLLGREGIFQKMIHEYGLSHIRFDKESLIAITDKDNQPLVDLKTPSDNEQAADKICNMIRMLTQNCNDTLHVSIAGGRKTMGFYAGYALSLYGRAQDRMSHVLVSSEYETLRGFYYPAKQPKQTIIKKLFKKIQNDTEVFEEVELDSFDAKIWLANIPFVRMRDAILPKHQLNPEHGKNFSEVVNEINKSFEPIQLTIFTKNGKREFQINDEQPIKLSPQYFAMLHWFADKKINQKIGIEAPKSDKADLDEKDQVDFFREWSDEYNHFYGKQKAKDDVIVDKEYFEIIKSKLNKTLVDKIGLALTNRIMPIKNTDSNLFEFPKDITIVLKG